MPLSLDKRRIQRFCPTLYTARHKQVAVLIAAGMRRTTVAQRLGYSRSHISRIVAMPETRREIDRLIVAECLKLFHIPGEFCGSR